MVYKKILLGLFVLMAVGFADAEVYDMYVNVSGGFSNETILNCPEARIDVWDGYVIALCNGSSTDMPKTLKSSLITGSGLSSNTSNIITTEHSSIEFIEAYYPYVYMFSTYGHIYKYDATDGSLVYQLNGTLTLNNQSCYQWAYDDPYGGSYGDDVCYKAYNSGSYNDVYMDDNGFMTLWTSGASGCGGTYKSYDHNGNVIAYANTYSYGCSGAANQMINFDYVDDNYALIRTKKGGSFAGNFIYVDRDNGFYKGGMPRCGAYAGSGASVTTPIGGSYAYNGDPSVLNTYFAEQNASWGGACTLPSEDMHGLTSYSVGMNDIIYTDNGAYYKYDFNTTIEADGRSGDLVYQGGNLFVRNTTHVGRLSSGYIDTWNSPKSVYNNLIVEPAITQNYFVDVGLQWNNVDANVSFYNKSDGSIAGWQLLNDSVAGGYLNRHEATNVGGKDYLVLIHESLASSDSVVYWSGATAYNPPAPDTSTVTGYVRDKNTNAGVSGVNVSYCKVGSLGEYCPECDREDRMDMLLPLGCIETHTTITDGLGRYSFNVTHGLWEIWNLKDGYGVTLMLKNINSAMQINISVADYTFDFKVKDIATNDPLESVFMGAGNYTEGSNNECFNNTNATGEATCVMDSYAFIYDLFLTKADYEPIQWKSLEYQYTCHEELSDPFECIQQTHYMTSEFNNSVTVDVLVYNSTDNQPIDDATVHVYLMNGSCDPDRILGLIDIVSTNSSGQAEIDLPQNELVHFYSYADGFYDYPGTFDFSQSCLMVPIGGGVGKNIPMDMEIGLNYTLNVSTYKDEVLTNTLFELSCITPSGETLYSGDYLSGSGGWRLFEVASGAECEVRIENDDGFDISSCPDIGGECSFTVIANYNLSVYYSSTRRIYFRTKDAYDNVLTGSGGTIQLKECNGTYGSCGNVSTLNDDDPENMPDKILVVGRYYQVKSYGYSGYAVGTKNFQVSGTSLVVDIIVEALEGNDTHSIVQFRMNPPSDIEDWDGKYCSNTGCIEYEYEDDFAFLVIMTHDIEVSIGNITRETLSIGFYCTRDEIEGNDCYSDPTFVENYKTYSVRSESEYWYSSPLEILVRDPQDMRDIQLQWIIGVSPEEAHRLSDIEEDFFTKYLGIIWKLSIILLIFFLLNGWKKVTE